MTILHEYIRALLIETLCPLPKAVFMAGGPGSGKSTVIHDLGLSQRLKVINPDDAYEESLKAAGIPLDRSKIVERYKELKQEYLKAVEDQDGTLAGELEPEYLSLKAVMSKNMKLFSAARAAAKKTQEQYTCDNENFLVDGTGGNLKQIIKQARELQALGYDVAMVFVDVPEETSLERNRQRGKIGGRRLTDTTVSRSWNAVAKNLEPYRDFFGDNFFYINASKEMFDSSISDALPGVSAFLTRD